MHDGRIVVVNTDPALLLLLQTLLSDEGYEVVTYITDDTTYPRIREAQPRMVVLDVGLQRAAAGWDVLKLIQFDPKTQHIPVLVTSVDHRFILEKATALQALGYDVLELPAPMEALLAKVEQLLGGLHSRKAS
jgi:DNA-binding response OmpR family regulator